MAESKVVINLATGLEDSERVTIAFLVGQRSGRAGQAPGDVPDQGNRPPRGTELRGGSRLRRLPTAQPPLRAVREHGGELLACPICAKARNIDEGNLVGNASLAGATPLWE